MEMIPKVPVSGGAAKVTSKEVVVPNAPPTLFTSILTTSTAGSFVSPVESVITIIFSVYSKYLF